MRKQLLCLAFLAAALAWSKAPLTHESMWMMKRVGGPKVSPDGKLVVFSVTEPSYDDKEQSTDLWIVPADGSAPARRLTSSKGGEGGVAWSPDSRRIAFTAKREGDEVPQIYVLDLAGGGEAQRVTGISTGASQPRWRPDGRALLFTSSVYPGAADDEANKKIAAERKARKYKARAYTGFPIRYWDHWLDDRKAHLFVQPLEPNAKARDLLAGTKLAESEGYSGAPDSTGGESLSAEWTPDGQAIVFSAAVNKNAAAYDSVDTHLFLLPAEGGEPRQITSGRGNRGAPMFRPDGKSLYFIETPDRPGNGYWLPRLARFDWPLSPGAQARILTAEFDRAPDAFDFSPDSKTLWFLAEDSGHVKLYTMPTEGGAVKAAFEVERGVYGSLSVAGEAIIGTWESAVNPAEVVRIQPGGGHKALTSFNTEAAAAIDWQPLRSFWFTSKRGRRIHNFVALPPNFDENRKYPLFVLMHGGPASMWRDSITLRWNYHLIASPGYIVLLTDYTGSTGYGEKFAQQIHGDPLATPGDEINEAADEAIKRFAFIDPAKQCAGGASYGGHLANWLQATTTRYRCLVSHAGLINLESQWGTSDTIYHRELTAGGPVWEQGEVWRKQNPIRYAAKFRTPMLLTVGERDFRVPLNQTIENWSVLQRLKIPSRLVVFEEANHWILKGEDGKYFYQELHAWLKKYLQE